MSIDPLVILAIGILTVLGMIIVLRANAFLALISAAMVVSVMAPGETSIKMTRVAEAFGSSVGKIGIVIALASIIGTCLMDSGAADRIVRAFLRVLGEKRASVALMGSGFVLSVPVFFDTVFYLLVPLARALWRRTNRDYVKYVIAIAAGGAVTHTMVPPTPGPLGVASILGVELGTMILVGLFVGVVPAVCGGILFAGFMNRRLNIPVRQVGSVTEPEPLPDSQLPGLFVSALPVLLPVILISAQTASDALVSIEKKAIKTAVSAVPAVPTPAPVAPVPATGSGKAAEKPSVPKTPTEQVASIMKVVGDANFALLVSTVIAMAVLLRQRNLKLLDLEKVVETSLMNGGVIILITAAGGAFGAMLRDARVGDAIQKVFGANEALSGQALLWLGFGVAAVLKVAQGSSTVAMITGASMILAMLPSTDPVAMGQALGFHPVYLALAISSGSLIGSWMNDSGFWVVAKMSGFTEWETLQTWTMLLIVLGITGMLTVVACSHLVPLVEVAR